MPRQITALAAIVVMCHCVSCYNITDLKTLKKTLLVDSEYDKSIRPVINQSDIVEVKLAFSITSIIDFDMVSGRIAVAGYLMASWIDEQLQWDPNDFNGISKVQLSEDQIWTPGLRNAYDLETSFAVARVNLYKEGRVEWLPASTFYSICVIDITYYPYDEHQCIFPIVSFRDDKSTIKLVPISDKIKLNNFNKNGEWEVVKTSSHVYEAVDYEMGIKTSNFLNVLTVKRRPMFAILHTYFPLLLLTCINILTFLVPLDKGERVSFSITMLLALIFFTSSLNETLPKNSIKPSYFSATMTLAICSSTVAVMLSVVLVRIDAETIRPVSPIFHQLVTRYKRHTLKSYQNNADCVSYDAQTEISSMDKGQTQLNDAKMMPVSEPSECQADTVTWSEVAYVLNVIFKWFYCILLIVSIVTLIALHHCKKNI